MKKIILIISLTLFVLAVSQNSFPQAGKNIRLLNHINPLDTLTQSAQFSAIWGYKAPDAREYAILGSVNGTYFIDITDSATTRIVGYVPGPQIIYKEMKTYSHYAYIVSDGAGSGVQIVDLQYLPDSVRYVGNYVPAGASLIHTISQEGPYLYLNGGSRSGIVVLDLSINPEVPVTRGQWLDLYVHDTRILNDTIWACNIGNNRVTVIDGRNKDSLKTITQWTDPTGSSPHNCALNPGRTYLYVTNELNDPGRLKVWDIRDLSNITLMRIYVPPLFENCISHNAEIYGNQLTVAYYEGGVKLFDVSDPVNFTEIGWYDTYPEDNDKRFNGCWGVYKFPSEKIIVSDMQKGLFVLKYNPPLNAKPKADFMTEKKIIRNGDSLQFYDCATNSQLAYNWKVTGPQTYTSASANPKIRFLSTGDYTIKLKVSNPYGSDSVEKLNCVYVDHALLNPFLLTGQLTQTIHTNRNDTSTVKFKWTRTSNSPEVKYKFSIKKVAGTVEYFIPSDNNGADTVITMLNSYLDTLAVMLGNSNDSIRTVSRIYAYENGDSLATVNSLVLTILSTSVGINQISSLIPREYKLHNNFPNPFNPNTIIKFDIPENAFVTMVLYDITGREVRKLVNENLAPGYYQYDFNGSNLSSGVYYYSMITGKGVQSGKMLMVK